MKFVKDISRLKLLEQEIHGPISYVNLAMVLVTLL